MNTPTPTATAAAHTPWCETHIDDEDFHICYGPAINLDFPARDTRPDTCHGARVLVTDDSISGRTVSVSLDPGQLAEILPSEARALAYALLAQASRADDDADDGPNLVAEIFSAGRDFGLQFATAKFNIVLGGGKAQRTGGAS